MIFRDRTHVAREPLGWLSYINVLSFPILLITFSFFFFSLHFSCWSMVGKVGGKQQISLGFGCGFHGIAVHEIGHALGMCSVFLSLTMFPFSGRQVTHVFGPTVPY